LRNIALLNWAFRLLFRRIFHIVTTMTGFFTRPGPIASRNEAIRQLIGVSRRRLNEVRRSRLPPSPSMARPLPTTAPATPASYSAPSGRLPSPLLNLLREKAAEASIEWVRHFRDGVVPQGLRRLCQGWCVEQIADKIVQQLVGLLWVSASSCSSASGRSASSAASSCSDASAPVALSDARAPARAWRYHRYPDFPV
jgi:hypothetical protein